MGDQMTDCGCTHHADLTEANLSWADLTRATLTRANLYRANLTGANLTDADLTEANLDGVRWHPDYPPTWPEGYDPPHNAWGETT